MEDGGGGGPRASIFTPLATRNGARKKETQRQLTKSWIYERHGNPALSNMRTDTQGSQTLLQQGAPRPPEGRLHAVYTKTHTTARAAGQLVHPGGGGHANTQATHGESPPPPPWGACMRATSQPTHQPPAEG